MSLRRRSLASLRALVVVALWPFVAHAAMTTFSDTEFADVDWTASEILDTTPNDSFVFSATVAGNGNPGNRRFVSNQLNTPTPSSIASGHLRAGATFDPGQDGTLLSLDASMDGISQPGNPAGAMAYAVLLEQDGNFFRGITLPVQILNGAGWETTSATGLVEADFIPFDGVSVLDLSNSGSVVAVGFSVSNGTFGTPSINVGGVDNWSVTIHSDPPPPVPALGGLGALALAALLVCTCGRARAR